MLIIYTIFHFSCAAAWQFFKTCTDLPFSHIPVPLLWLYSLSFHRLLCNHLHLPFNQCHLCLSVMPALLWDGVWVRVRVKLLQMEIFFFWLYWSWMKSFFAGLFSKYIKLVQSAQSHVEWILMWALTSSLLRRQQHQHRKMAECKLPKVFSNLPSHF